MRLRPGLLITCDMAVCEYLKNLNSTLPTSSADPEVDTQFILYMVDETHLMIEDRLNIIDWLKIKLDEWHDQHAFAAKGKGTEQNEEDEEEEQQQQKGKDKTTEKKKEEGERKKKKSKSSKPSD